MSDVTITTESPAATATVTVCPTKVAKGSKTHVRRPLASDKPAKPGKVAKAAKAPKAKLPIFPAAVRYVLKSGEKRELKRSFPGKDAAAAQAAALAWVKSARGRAIAKYL